MRFIWIALFSCCLLFSPLSVVAQEGSGSAALERVSYDLPHPGILPDNAMYPVKMFRDRVVSMLISDPVKKAEFNLLQADKRLQAGIYLLNKETTQAELALTAISKGENYFLEAVDNARNAKKQGFYTGDIAHKMSLAIRKHSEVIKDIEKKVPQQDKAHIVALEKQLAQIKKEVSNLIQK